MKLIVGLGNPGEKYNFTRHNFGFLALDFLAKIQGWSWEKPKFHGIWAKVGDVVYLKPQTFYNDSGLAVQEWMHFYKLKPEEILVLSDDFNLPFGTLRYRAKGQSGGNNGLKSIAKHLGTEEFPRLRLGTGNEEMRQKMGDVDFVLGKFTDEEKEKLPEILQEVVAKVNAVVV